MFYLMKKKKKKTILFNIKVTKIERSAFLGHPVYSSLIVCCICMVSPIIEQVFLSSFFEEAMCRIMDTEFW